MTRVVSSPPRWICCVCCGVLLTKFEMRFLWLLFLRFTVVLSRQQWYLTGTNFNDHRNFTVYSSEVINLWLNEQQTAENHSHEPILNYTHSSFGGAIAVYVGYNQTVEKDVQKLIDEMLNVNLKEGSFKLEILHVWVYDIFVTVDQNTSLQYEIGLYDHAS